MQDLVWPSPVVVFYQVMLLNIMNGIRIKRAFEKCDMVYGGIYIDQRENICINEAARHDAERVC